MLEISLVLLAVSIALSYCWVKYKFSYWQSRGFLQAAPQFPFGNIKDAATTERISQKLAHLYKDFKDKAPVFGIYVSVLPAALITDLEVIQHVLKKDFCSFHDRGFYFNTKNDPLSGVLFAIEGQDWKQMRPKFTQSLTLSKTKMMFSTIVHKSEDILNYLLNPERTKELDVSKLMVAATMDAIGNFALGLDTNCIKDPDSLFVKMGKKVFHLSPLKTAKMLFLNYYSSIAKTLGMRLTDLDVEEFFLGSFKETVNYRNKNNIARPDFMNTMMQFKSEAENDVHNKKSKDTLFNELAAQCYMIFTAGFETTSSAMSFCLYELAMNEDVQNILRREILQVLEKHGNNLTYDSMAEMKYLQMVIEETLRKHPPGDFLMRKATNNYKVPNTTLTIPKDTMVFIPVYSIQHDDEFYPKPEKFDPERFSDENRKSRHPMTYLPFGGGPRSCIGVNFAYMEMKIVVIMLVSKFKFSPSAKTTEYMEYSPDTIALTPKNEVWLNVDAI